MKFLVGKSKVVKDKELNLEVRVKPATNKRRFILHDLAQDQTASGFITLAEYLLDSCVESVSVGKAEYSPEEIKAVDLTDEESATIYRRIVELALESQLDTINEEDRKK